MPVEDQGLAHSRGRYALIPRVLCFVLAGEDVLLLKGAPDKKIWPGKYNGLGGHVERGESVHAAARREIVEESGLETTGLCLRGVITIDTGPEAGIGLYVFTANAPASRAMRPGREGAPEWIPIRRLAEVETVEDLPVLLSRLLAMRPGDPPFSAAYAYGQDGRLEISFDD